jgi:succinate dehydrogenase cytochrome b subunit
MALTGLFLCSFLIVHLLGNLQLFENDGGRAFERYAEFMSTNLEIRILEIGLFAGFLVHIIWGLRTWWSNRAARPERYVMVRASENSTLTSRIMFITGSIVFIFLVVHLKNFFVPTRFPATDKVSDFELVKAVFANPIYDGLYFVGLALLGYHLRQGFQSAFQTFGLRPAWRLPVDLVAIVFWLIIPIMYATMPLYFLWVSLKGVN